MTQYLTKLKKVKYYKLKIAAVVLHTLLLMLLTIALQYSGLVRIDETAFFKFFALTKDLFNPDAGKPPEANHTVFINVSRDLQLADDASINGYDAKNGLAGAKIVLVDRLKLARLFQVLNNHPKDYRFVLCDIKFEDHTPADSTLKTQIEKTTRLLVAADFDGTQLVPPIFKVAYGGISYLDNNGDFVTLPVFYNQQQQSLPVMMAEQLRYRTYTRRGGLTLEDHRFAFNTLIPELYFRQTDLVRGNDKRDPNLFDLGDLLSQPDFFNLHLKNKYIVIGNFVTDTHQTYLGQLPGSLLLFNAFLTIKQHALAITRTWLLFMILVYGLISYRIIMHSSLNLEKLGAQIKIRFLAGFLKKYISYLGIMIVVSLFSYIYFGHFISLFFIATYLTLLEQVLEKSTLYIRSRNLKNFLKEA